MKIILNYSVIKTDMANANINFGGEASYIYL